MTLRIFFVILALLFVTDTYAQQIIKNDFLILENVSHLPAGSERVGKVRVTDGGFKTNCGYDQTILQARTKAQRKNGNAIVITDLKSPDGISTCYRLTADVYHVDDINAVHIPKENRDSILRTIIPDSSYALLFVYRPPGASVLVQYNLHVNDSNVYRVTNNNETVIKLTKSGKTVLWARTEARAEVSLDVKLGEIYFLRCTVQMGVFVGQPSLNLVDFKEGLKVIGLQHVQQMASELEQKDKG